MNNRLNLIEKHPWIRFPKENGNIQNLIVGSFPPNKFTIKKEKRMPGDIDFFYGSNQNLFWELFCDAVDLKINWRCKKAELKSWLIKNNWGVTDIVASACRPEKNPDSSADDDLCIISTNNDVIREIIENNPVKKICFTSKWVKTRFDKVFPEKIISKAGQVPGVVVLIAPSPAGLISTHWANEYLSRKEKESPADYRRRYYKKFLNP